MTNRPTPRRLRLAAVLLAAASACRTPTTPDSRVVVGTLATAARQALQVPDTVVAGTPFDVTVMTIGNSCIAPAGADVRVDGLVVTVTPYDRIANSVCLDILTGSTRTASVRLPNAGTASVRALGANGGVVARDVVVLPARL